METLPTVIPVIPIMYTAMKSRIVLYLANEQQIPINNEQTIRFDSIQNYAPTEEGVRNPAAQHRRDIVRANPQQIQHVRCAKFQMHDILKKENQIRTNCVEAQAFAELTCHDQDRAEEERVTFNPIGTIVIVNQQIIFQNYFAFLSIKTRLDGLHPHSAATFDAK